MCRRESDETEYLGGETDRVDEVDGRNVETDWLPIGDVVSGLLRGWRLDDE
jgi:hypothetical protein